MQTHLKGFGLENFRVFKDYTWFDFAPITILTGPNSSGKSSLNKALMLMKDNLTERRQLFSSEAKYPLSNRIKLDFEGSAHNLSSEKNAITKESRTPFISFFFKNNFSIIDLPILKRIGYLVRSKAIEIETDKDSLKKIFQSSNYTELWDSENRVFIRSVSGSIPRFYCDISAITQIATQFLDKLQDIMDRELNAYESYSLQYDSVHPERKYLDEMRSTLREFINNFSVVKFDHNEIDLVQFFQKNGPFFQENIFQENISDDISYFDSKISWDVFSSLFSHKVETHFGFLLVMNGYGAGFNKSDVHELFPENTDISVLINSFVLTLSILTGTFETCKGPIGTPEILLPDLGDLYYLPSIKGFNERSFRSKDEHVLNVLFKEYIKNYEIDEMIGVEESRRAFFEKWFNKFGLENMKMERDDRLDSNFYTVNGFSNVDIGYGMTQIIAVILRILSVADSIEDQEPFPKPTIIILEEPEANLHPKYQSILADMICDAAKKFQIQFIIETHSEYLIRKLQYLTAKKEIQTSDSVIYYFHDPNNVPKDEKQVKKIEILEDGSLSDDFGPGFFDEAANWELELIRLKNSKNRNN